MMGLNTQIPPKLSVALYTVCYLFLFLTDTLFAMMDIPKLKHGRVEIRNLGLKGLIKYLTVYCGSMTHQIMNYDAFNAYVHTFSQMNSFIGELIVEKQIPRGL